MKNIISYKEKKQLATAIMNLSKAKQIEIFKIIKNQTDKYTFNDNGVFINIKCISNELIHELQQFINNTAK